MSYRYKVTTKKGNTFYTTSKVKLNTRKIVGGSVRSAKLVKSVARRPVRRTGLMNYNPFRGI